MNAHVLHVSLQKQHQQLRKCSSVGSPHSSLDQPPSSLPSPSPSTSRQRSPSSHHTCSPPSSHMVTPHGFTSTSTSSLNYPLSYLTNMLQHSSLDCCLPSPVILHASSPTSLSSCPRALSLACQQCAVSSSTILMRHANGGGKIPARFDLLELIAHMEVSISSTLE